MSEGNYDIGQLVAEILMDTSEMNKGISEAKRILSGFEGSVNKLGEATERQTKVMEASFKNVNSTLTDFSRRMGGINSAIRQTSNATISALRELNGTNLTALDSGFRNLRTGIDQCVVELRALNTGLSSLKGHEPAVRNLASGFNSFGRSMRNSSKDGESLFLQLSHLSLYGYVIYQDLQFIGQAIAGIFKPGLEFTMMMENAQIGMAAIMTSTLQQSNGEQLEFNDAMKISTTIMDDLRKVALRTTATMEELVTTYQAILGPGTAGGMNLREIEKITALSVNAVKAMGLKKDQLVQEIRSILTEGITTKGSAVATALGITNKQIEEAKGQAHGLFNFLTERLAGFDMALKENEGTFGALWSNIQDGIQQTEEIGFAPFFKVVKSELKGIQDMFFNITRYKEDTIINGVKFKKDDIKESKLNPQTVAVFARIGEIASQVTTDIKTWVVTLSNNTKFMKRLHDLFDGVSQLAKGIYDNIGLIGEALAISWAFSDGWLKAILAVAYELGGLPALLRFIADHIETIAKLWMGWMVISKISGLVMSLAETVIVLDGAMGVLGRRQAFVLGAMRANILSLLGPIGLATVAVWTLIDAMHQAKLASSESQRNDLANASGSYAIEQDFQPRDNDHRKPGMSNEQANQVLVENTLKQESEAEIQRINDLMNSLVLKHAPEDKGGKSGRSAGSADKTEREAERVASALAKVREAQDKFNEQLKEADIQGVLDDIDIAYKNHEMSMEEYYESLAKNSRALAQAKIAVFQAKRDEEQGLFDRANEAGDDLKAEEHLAKVIDLDAQIIAKNAEMEKQQAKIVRDKNSATESYNKTLEGIEANYLRMQGKNGEASTLENKGKYKNTYADLNNEIAYATDQLPKATNDNDKKKWQDIINNRTKLIKLLDANVEATIKSNEVTDIVKAKEEKQLALDRAKLDINTQLKNGTITTWQAKQKVYDAENQMAKELEVTLAGLETKEKALLPENVEGINSVRKSITEVKSQILSLSHPLTAIADQVKTDFTAGMENAFEGLITQTKSVSSAFRDMAKSILNSIAKIAANNLASSIAGSLFGGSRTPISPVSTSNYGGLSLGNYQIHRASGGAVTGAGTSTSDSIPAMLSNGEFVLRAQAVKKIGLAKLYALNSYGNLPALPTVSKFANGGAVGSSSAITSGSGSNTAQNFKVEIVNNSGTQLQAKTGDVKFDGVTTVMTLWLEGVVNNVGHSQDFIKSIGGRR